MKADSGVRVIVKEIPILGPDSVEATQASLASIGQGKYYPFHVALYGAKGNFKDGRILKIAESAGLDTERLKRDMDSPRVTQIIQKNLALAKALGVRGTPGLIVGEELVFGVVRSRKLRQLVARTRG